MCFILSWMHSDVHSYKSPNVLNSQKNKRNPSIFLYLNEFQHKPFTRICMFFTFVQKISVIFTLKSDMCMSFKAQLTNLYVYIDVQNFYSCLLSISVSVLQKIIWNTPAWFAWNFFRFSDKKALKWLNLSLCYQQTPCVRLDLTPPVITVYLD